jgi:hypothetical protein
MRMNHVTSLFGMKRVGFGSGAIDVIKLYYLNLTKVNNGDRLL